MAKKLEWAPDPSFASGKGATVQRYVADDGVDVFEIFTTPWGDGDLVIDGKQIAHVAEDLSPGDAFRDLEAIAELVEERKHG